MGAKTTYRKERCEEVVALMREGKSKKEAAAAMGVPWTTFRAWVDANPEFKEAVDWGAELYRAKWEETMRLVAFGEKQGGPPAVLIFNMKNRFKDEWMDVQKQEISGNNGGPLQFQSVADVDKALAAALADLPESERKKLLSGE